MRLPVSDELLADAGLFGDLVERELTYPRLGPPAPPAHDSHRFSDEGLEGCLLCGESQADVLVTECPYIVVERGAKP